MTSMSTKCLLLLVLVCFRTSSAMTPDPSNHLQQQQQQAAEKWTKLPRTDHPSGIPLRTSSPQDAFRLAQRDGASVLTGVDTETASGVSAAALQVFGDSLVAIQAPIHVGTNNFGFKGGTPITNHEARPAHVDTIVQYQLSPYEAPDYFLLCARIPSAVGGESFLADLPAATRRMTPEKRQHLMEHLHVMQRIELPPDYNRLSQADAQQQTEKQDVSAVEERVERFVVVNKVSPERPAYRVSSFSDADSLLAHMLDNSTLSSAPIRPIPSSTQPAFDLETTLDYLQAVAAETAVAGCFRLETGDCAIVDNYKVAHGREAYRDLGRSLWQIWAWTNTSIAVPVQPGPNRQWEYFAGAGGMATTTSAQVGEL